MHPLVNPKSNVRYSRLYQGQNTPENIMENMAAEGQLKAHKVNHSCQKTFAETLLHLNIENTEVAQLSGWKSIQTLIQMSAMKQQNSFQT